MSKDTVTKRRGPTERVTALLTKNKALTEKEVIEQIKGADRKMVREARRALGIDRPAAITTVRGWLENDPNATARSVIMACMHDFGIRLGPPDVSRLRPKKKKKSLAHFPTVAEEEAASRVAGFLANVMDSVRGKRGTRAREVRAAIQTIATHLNDRMKGTK